MAKEIIGIVVGGGPAPGINGVISAAAIEAIDHGRQVLGIIGGFTSLFEGREDAFVPLTIDTVSRIHRAGGSILGTSRDTPAHARANFKTLMSALKKSGIRHLVAIGGEGTLFVANWIQQEGRGRINVVHAPKTIDNDIPLPGGHPTFGYETARHLGVNIVSNLMEDARTMGRWYFVTTMGRHSGHLALGIGQAAGATITLIPEEFPETIIPIGRLTDILTCSIVKRLSFGKNHGVAVFAEGIVERLNAEELKTCEDLEHDSTGRIRLSEIQLGRALKWLVQREIKSLGIQKVTILDKNVGYELRASPPIPFDIEYSRALGYGAIRHLLKGGSGAMIARYEGKIVSIPFADLLERDGTARVRRVSIHSELYEVARNYMIRLEKGDLEGKGLARMARAAKMKPSAFKNRFAAILDRDTGH